MGNTQFFKEASKEKSQITWKDIFSESFVKHSKADREFAMQTGTILRQVPESRMLSSWHKPWLWWTIAKAGLALIALLYVTVYLSVEFTGSAAISLVQMLMIIPPLVFPLIIMVFFWEMNIPQNISLVDVGGFFLVSAVVSFAVTGIAFLVIPSGYAAKYAALREEPAKLTACIVILYYIQRVQKKKIYGLTGLVVGAIVGAAFSGIESVSYAMDSGTIPSIVENQLMRGLFSIAGHIAYAIPYSCAMALHTENGKITPSSVFRMETLGAFCLSIALHWLWNSSRGYFVPIALCCVAPFRYIYWIRKCLTQIVTICAPQTGRQGAYANSVMLYCKTTALKGSCWKCNGEPLVIGRQSGQCGLCLPADTPGVSREHCRVFLSPIGWVVQDLNSSCGTFVDGRKLAPYETVAIRSGSNLFVGSKNVWITVL